VPQPANIDLDCYSGDTWAQTFRLISNGVPVDLTGAQVAAWARRSETVEQLQVTVDPTLGEVTIAQPAAGGLEPGPYQYDVEVISQDGTVKTWIRGRLIVERDVTHGDLQPVAAAVSGY
jgi:hypothetical protein